MTTNISLDRMLGDRIRTAIHDPARYTDRRGAAEDHAVELRSEWTARAVVLAIERGLFENDYRLVPGKTLFELEQRAAGDRERDLLLDRKDEQISDLCKQLEACNRILVTGPPRGGSGRSQRRIRGPAMTPQTPIPGPHSAADGPTALPEGPGGVATPNGAHGDDERNDAGLLAFIVRDLMDAARYQYRSDRPLAEQARRCEQLIRDIRAMHNDERSRNAELKDLLAMTSDRHEAEVRRLTDLADELRKHVAGADRHAEQLQEQVTKLHKLIQDRDAQLYEVRTDLQDALARIANLDRLLQERDASAPSSKADPDLIRPPR